MYFYLLPAARRVEFILFFRPKLSFGQRRSADCKQRGGKWSAEVAELVSPQPATREPLPLYHAPEFYTYYDLACLPSAWFGYDNLH